jgi:succinate-acetate transporter protein
MSEVGFGPRGEGNPTVATQAGQPVVPQQGSAAVTEAPPVVSVRSTPAGIADPGPLGLAGFAMTTFVLSVFNAKLVGNAKLEPVVLPLALFYGGIAQLLAGMWEFRKDNTFGALAFTSYGAFWMGLAAYIKFVAPGLPAADAHTATAIYLGAWTIFTLYMWVSSLQTNAAVAAVFTVLLITFVLLTFGNFNPDTTLAEIGGWFGIATAILAWYASFAGVMNATWGKTMLPTYPLKK